MAESIIKIDKNVYFRGELIGKYKASPISLSNEDSRITLIESKIKETRVCTDYDFFNHDENSLEYDKVEDVIIELADYDDLNDYRFIEDIIKVKIVDVKLTDQIKEGRDTYGVINGILRFSLKKDDELTITNIKKPEEDLSIVFPKKIKKSPVKKSPVKPLKIIWILFIIIVIILLILSETKNYKRKSSNYEYPKKERQRTRDFEENLFKDVPKLSKPSKEFDDYIKNNSYESFDDNISQPVNGFSPYDSYFGRGKYDYNALNTIIVHSPSTSNIVFLLKDVYSGKTIRNEYIRKNSTFNLTNIPYGTYTFSYFSGKNWSESKTLKNGRIKGGFTKNISFSKSDKVKDWMEFNEDYQGQYEITLTQVAAGNLETESTNEDDFFK